MADKLFVFGLGYSALVLARRFLAAGGTVAGTCQGTDRQRALAELGITVHPMDRARPLAGAAERLAGTTHLLSSVPPDDAGDPVLDLHGADVAALGGLRWAGYLSTAGVYGDAGGAVVDEAFARAPTSARSRRRMAAEDGWLDLWRSAGTPVHLFRLAGIYGPGRSALDKVRAGTARMIAKPGHRFSRIHVDDIAGVLRASMARPRPGAAYNLCDDEPAEPAAVTGFAYDLLGLIPPDPEPFETARRGLSPMALSFWNDNRLLSNRRLHDELCYEFRYPTYREGLRACLKA